MIYNERRWVIVNTSDLTDDMKASGISDTFRESLDGSKSLIKWDGETPSCFEGMAIYNHSEILEELTGSDWAEEIV